MPTRFPSDKEVWEKLEKVLTLEVDEEEIKIFEHWKKAVYEEGLKAHQRFGIGKLVNKLREEATEVLALLNDYKLRNEKGRELLRESIKTETADLINMIGICGAALNYESEKLLKSYDPNVSYKPFNEIDEIASNILVVDSIG